MLEDYRREIDCIDTELVTMLARRYRLCEEIAQLKKERGIPMMHSQRVEAVLTRCSALGIRWASTLSLWAECLRLLSTRFALWKTPLSTGWSERRIVLGSSHDEVRNPRPSWYVS
jgi:hypothetical protein